MFNEGHQLLDLGHFPLQLLDKLEFKHVDGRQWVGAGRVLEGSGQSPHPAPPRDLPRVPLNWLMPLSHAERKITFLVLSL